MNTRQKGKNDGGHILISVLFLVALSLLITAGMLDSSSTNSKTRALVTTQADQYYDVEDTVNRVLGWLQDNSVNLAGLFESTEFLSKFEIGAPSIGSNEGEQFRVPTLVKLAGTDESAILSNHSFFGESAFPLSTNIQTGTSFDVVSAFQNADFGNANARLVMVWARQTNGAYEPVFRVDVITGNQPDRGVHSYSHVYSKVIAATSSNGGFYGKDALKMGNSASTTCSSLRFQHVNGAWVKGGGSSGCFLASDATVTIDGTVSGSAGSLAPNGVVIDKGSLSILPPCEGAGCHSFVLENYPNWASACPGVTTDIVASQYGGTLSPGCYRDLTVDADFAITNTSAPYRFRKINFQGNNKELTFGAIPVGQKITIFVEEIDSNTQRSQLTGNRVMNKNSSASTGKFNAPHQLEIKYTGTLPIFIAGTTDVYARLYAPYVTVTASGNTDFYGSIEAKNIQLTGNGDFFYDESIGVTQPISDLSFEVRKTSQRYR